MSSVEPAASPAPISTTVMTKVPVRCVSFAKIVSMAPPLSVSTDGDTITSLAKSPSRTKQVQFRSKSFVDKERHAVPDGLVDLNRRVSGELRFTTKNGRVMMHYGKFVVKNEKREYSAFFHVKWSPLVNALTHHRVRCTASLAYEAESRPDELVVYAVVAANPNLLPTLTSEYPAIMDVDTVRRTGCILLKRPTGRSLTSANPPDVYSVPLMPGSVKRVLAAKTGAAASRERLSTSVTVTLHPDHNGSCMRANVVSFA